MLWISQIYDLLESSNPTEFNTWSYFKINGIFEHNFQLSFGSEDKFDIKLHLITGCAEASSNACNFIYNNAVVKSCNAYVYRQLCRKNEGEGLMGLVIS